MLSTTSRAVRLLAAALIVLAAVAATALAVVTRSLSSFLLSSHEQTGYSVSGHPAIQSSTKAFVSYGGGSTKTKETETAELTKAGFIAAADEQLRASHGRQGFSLVMEFTSAAGAQSAATNLFKNAIAQQGKGAKLIRFKVKGVPGAKGVIAVGAGASTSNVYWADGQCAFGSGDYVPKQAGALDKPVITGVQSVHQRVKGACPS
jgi:hypothetical protein